MVFERSEFRTALAKWLEEWQPDVVVLDPWNSAARDDGQRDYLEVFQSLKEVLPKGDVAPALVIVAHTRKPRGEERKTGRGLLNEIAGSHVLATVPRSAFVLLHASDDPEDDRVVWTCSKNNDGELGGRTAWHRRNGLFLLFLPRVVISQENICEVDFLPGPAHRRIRHGVIETCLYLGRLRELTRFVFV